MEKMGAELVRRGFSIISGNASGADQAWVRGGNDVDPAKVKLCLPWRSFEAQAIHPGNVVAVLDELQSSEKVSYFHLAAKYHPAWDQLMLGARKLHARNAMIVEPAQELVGYVDHSRPGGGGPAWPSGSRTGISGSGRGTCRSRFKNLAQEVEA